MQEVKGNFSTILWLDYTIDSKRTTRSVKDENHLFYYEEEKEKVQKSIIPKPWTD